MSNHSFIIHLFKVPACLDLNFSERCFTEEPGCTVLRNSTKYVRCYWCLVYHIQYDCIHLAILNNHLINGLLTQKDNKNCNNSILLYAQRSGDQSDQCRHLSSSWSCCIDYLCINCRNTFISGTWDQTLSQKIRSRCV